VDVYSGGDLRKMKPPNTFGRSGQIRSQRSCS
jgi:hypothetical protein